MERSSFNEQEKLTCLKPTLEQMISLELLDEHHKIPVHVLANHPDISPKSSVPYPCEMHDVEQWIAENRQTPENQQLLSFVIMYGILEVGICRLNKIDLEARSTEISYWIGRAYWGRGIGTTAACKMRDYAFHELNFLRLDAHYLKKNNEHSGHLLEKLGFEQDTSRADLPTEGRFAQKFPDDVWTFCTMSRAAWQKITNHPD
jgi:RimJ/RimL family protein N-acetyltransferase